MLELEPEEQLATVGTDAEPAEQQVEPLVNEDGDKSQRL